MFRNAIIIDGNVHILVKHEGTEPYCDACSLRTKCLLHRHPCHVLGATKGYRFS